MSTRDRSVGRGAGCFRHAALAVSFGAVVWFGVQLASGRDNFSDTVNPTYFGALYGTGLVLGLISAHAAGRAGIALAVSQVVFYVIYPNIAWELGNLFPIAAGMLFVATLPAVGLAFVAGLLVRASRRGDAPAQPAGGSDRPTHMH